MLAGSPLPWNNIQTPPSKTPNRSPGIAGIFIATAAIVTTGTNRNNGLITYILSIAVNMP